MHKIHVAAIALLLGASAMLGVAAATRTAGLGRMAAARPITTKAAFAARARRLDRIEVALRRSLRRWPPKLPLVPAVRRPASAAAPVATAPQRVIYQRPPPIVKIKHRPHGDDHESEGGAGGGDD